MGYALCQLLLQVVVPIPIRTGGKWKCQLLGQRNKQKKKSTTISSKVIKGRRNEKEITPNGIKTETKTQQNVKMF